MLGRAITLVESTQPRHAALAQELLRALGTDPRQPPGEASTIRVGVTGVPGVGKSTFIERLGLQLCAAGHRVAVLAVATPRPCAWYGLPTSTGGLGC